MTAASRNYSSAAGRDWLLPLYDPCMDLLGAERARSKLLEEATLQPGQRVLDIGCGTGSFALFIKRRHPQVEVVGIDPDPLALARARRKADRSRLAVEFTQGFADELPYTEASFDRVFSTFMLHHLSNDAKDKTLREARRVLKPCGTFHLLDIGGPDGKGENFLVRKLRSIHGLADNAEERILHRLCQAGLADPKRVGRDSVLVWHIVRYRASAPRG